MRSLLLLGTLVVVSASLVGCAGVVQTSEQAGHTLGQVHDMNMAQFGDDMNYLTQNDRPSRLTKWITR